MPYPRPDVVVKFRYQRVVARAALVDPPLRRECVEIADELGLLHRAAGSLDPDVRSRRLVVLSRPQEEPDHPPLAKRPRPTRVPAPTATPPPRESRRRPRSPLRAAARRHDAPDAEPPTAIPPRRGDPAQTHESPANSPNDDSDPNQRKPENPRPTGGEPTERLGWYHPTPPLGVRGEPRSRVGDHVSLTGLR